MRITHVPTGIIATSSEKSQIKTVKSTKSIKSKSFDMMVREEHAKYAEKGNQLLGQVTVLNVLEHIITHKTELLTIIGLTIQN